MIVIIFVRHKAEDECGIKVNKKDTTQMTLFFCTVTSGYQDEYDILVITRV